MNDLQAWAKAGIPSAQFEVNLQAAITNATTAGWRELAMRPVERRVAVDVARIH